MADGQLNIQAKLDINDLVKTAARYRQEVTRMGVVTDQQGNVMSTAWTRMKQAATAYLSIDLARKIAETRGQFQQLEVAFTTLLGSQEKSAALMSQLVETAAKTPFDLKGVADGARQLLAYGFAAEDVNETLIRLGNVAAGLGLPLERLTFLYGTTAVQGRLYARDMLQFQSSGIPVLQGLADMYGKTTSEINDMVTAGKIGFEDVRKVIEQMTNEGGKFYNLMENQSKTITGQISNLSDALDMMFNNIGQANEGIISDVISGAAYIVENYQSVINILKVLVATYGTYKAALIAVAAAQKISVSIQTISTWLSLAKTIRTAKDAQIAFNLATKANPYVLLATVLVGVGTALYQFTKKTDTARIALEKFNKEAEKQAEEIKTLIGIASDETNATYSRQLALESLRKIDPQYFKDMDLESLKTVNLIELNDRLAKAIREKNKADAETKIKETQNAISAIKKEIDFLNKTAVKNRGERLNKANKRLKELNQELGEQNSILNKINSDIKSQEEAEKRAKEEAAKRGEEVKKTVKWYEDEIKALKDLQETSTTSNEFNDYQKRIDQLNKEKEAITGASKATKDAEKRRLETVKKINEELLSLEEQNQNSRIELMKEGTEKEIAQINLDYQRRITEIKKLADKWAKEQGGKLTTEQNIQVSTAFTSAENIKNKDTAEVYKKELDDLLKQYQDFDAKRRSIDDKYAKDKQTLESRRTTSNASEIDSAINELNYQKEEALKEIAMEFASRNEEFEIWMNQIATFSMEELQKRLREARALLGSLQIAGVGGDKLAEAIAKVVTLEKEIANQKKKTSTSPDKRSVKDWQELYKTLSKVDEQFKEIGDSIGGTAGELLSSAGSISTAILSMIDGIITLTTGSIKSVEGMSDAAAKAIKAVETASVILAIVSAALQVVTKIFSMFKGKSKAEKDSERLSKVTNKIAETNEIINNLIEKRIDLIKAATTAERNGLKLTTEEAIKAQQDLIQVQYSKLWKNEILGKKGKNNDLDVRDLGLATVEQLKDFLSGGQIAFKDGFTTLIELEKQGYSLTDADKWKSIVEEWDKLNEQADQLKETVSEINTGINFDEARDGLDDFLLSADTTFKDISDNFEDYMRQSILNVVKSDYLNKEMKEWYDQFDKMSKDGALSASDVETLREKYETIYNEAQNRIDELLNAAGVNLEGAVPNSQAGAISETITEETASVMMGIWRGQYDVTKNIHTELISLHSDYKAAISKSNDILDMIASNTGRTADNTDGIGTTLKSIDNRLKTLETNSNKKYTK
ncbi:MAG TPA: tape measure protein [Butyricimonas virosa]|uniref:Tape measure protein n=1 Tax=Butyricimonas virosa TaxID=544645 RepID=A0A921H701_9BACT|nr:tape measure protein [Butyricimonas virosa]